MSNINDTYFDGHYKDIWKSTIPAELTVKEVDFMLKYFSLQPGNKVLDIMCGYGRHAIALAEKGIAVTAVDNLEAYVNEVKEFAEKEALPIRAVKENILRYKDGGRFDLAICMGNSLNFFNAEDSVHILKNIAGILNPNGHLLINTWSLTEIVVKSFTSRSWTESNGLKFIHDSEYLFHPTRIEWDSFILSPDGSMEKKKAIDYIFSVSEMESMLNEAGFAMEEIFSIPGRKKFSLGEPRAYIVAKKN
jgi:2-polyprenyl-3-methyl-5-hydroxy-6-metoxy-1,4-benzoquinol methylase